jgi:hypothetical protein
VHPVQDRRIEHVWTSVGAALGVPGLENRLGLPDAPRWVVALVDGLGELNLRENAIEAPFLSSLTAVPDVRCGLPSTTVTSLTSLGTGLRPGRHGVAGYTVRVPETGERLNSIAWDLPLDPLAWQPHAMVLEQLAAAGVGAAAVNESRFAGSALTLCTQRGVPYHGVSSSWERLDVLVDVVESSDRSAVYAYESRLDHAGHAYGCQSEEWREMLRTVDTELRQIREDLPADTRLLVTADHGMLDLPMDDRFDVDQHPRLLDDVELLAGEARFRHLYTAQGSGTGTAAAVADRWRTECGDRADVRLRAECEDWFGPLDPAVADRFGDVIVAAQGDFAVFSSREFAREMLMTGFHGSTSEVETRIPVLIA